jgi:WD40 repeat protein
LEPPDEFEVEFDEPVLSFSVHGSFLLVVLRTGVCFYDLDRRKRVLDLLTGENSPGCGDVSLRGNNVKLAICGLMPGAFQILTPEPDNRPHILKPHTHPVSIIQFSADGALVATASEYGTLIRVFCSVSATLLGIFRRGSLQSRILAIAFSPRCETLVAVSEKGTVHAFALASRVTNPAWAPRSFRKLKLGKVELAAVGFASEKEFMVICGSGMCYFMAIDKKTMSIVTTAVIEQSPEENVELP